MIWVEEPAPVAGKIKVKIICPLYTVVEMEAVQVSVPAVQGERMIIPAQAPLFTGVKPGRVLVYRDDDHADSYFVSQGICEVRRDICVILAWGAAEKKVSIDEIRRQLEDAEASIASAGSGVVRHNVSERIRFFKMVLTELESNKGSV